MKESEDTKDDAINPQVVEVIPILKGLPKAALTYFYRGVIKEGEFVHIVVRGNAAMALVSQVRDVRESRSNLRSGAFALKKLSGKATGGGISRALIRAAERTATFYATTTGAVLGALIPKLFLDDPNLLNFNFENTERVPREPVVIQLETPERFSTYKSIIRENFAKKQSVLFIASTNESARRAHVILSQGIEDYAYLFTLIEKKRSIKEALNQASSNLHPILFVTTPAGIVFDRQDLATIILENENTKSYRTRTRPHISFKKLIEFYSQFSGKELIMGDSALSIETLWKEKSGKFTEFTPLKWRITPPSTVTLVDMKLLKDEMGKFEIFSPEMKTLVSTALATEEQVFLFGARKGLAPTTVCGDCGTILPCLNCGAPSVLHKKEKDERIYVCHACSATRPAETRCDVCNSWKLVPLGIGIDRIADEARALWPEAELCIFDRDHIATATEATRLIKKIRGAGPLIIVGTELFTLYKDSVLYSGIVSMDSLFSIPDFGIHERIFSLVTKIREMTTRDVVIQTRNIGKDILTQAAKGDILGFYRSEIEDRGSFMYPPFSIFIKASKELNGADVSEEASRLKNLFNTWNPEFMKVRGKKYGTFVLSMIIRMRHEEWPEKELGSKLALLGTDFIVKVDPESIL